MEIKFNKKDNNEALIKISLKPEDYQEKVNSKIKEYARKAHIKGFRPGKVPTTYIKKMYGKSILVDEINHQLHQALNEYIKNEKLEIIGEPIPVRETTEGIDWDNQTEFEFEYKLGLVEDFKLDISPKQKLTRYEIKVDKKVMQETIENLQEQYATMTNPDECTDGDMLFGTLVAPDGKEYQGLIDLKKLDKKEAKQFVGARPGDEISFDIRKTLKADALIAEVLGLAPEEAARAEGNFTLKVKNINRKVKAEINQEFFDRLFGKDEVKTEEEFNKRIEESIINNYSKESDWLLERDIRRHFVEKTRINTPDDFLKDWLLVSNEGKVTREQIDKEYDDYLKDLKWSLIRNRIAREQEMKADEGEIRAKVLAILAEQFGGPGVLAQLGDRVNEFVKTYLEGNEGQNYYNVVNQVLTDKVYGYIKDNITINTKKVSLDEFRKKAEAA